MLDSIQNVVRIVFDSIPGEKGHYFYEPKTRPLMVINEKLSPAEQKEIILALYVESKIQFSMPGRELYPFELSYPVFLPTPKHRQWLENGTIPKLNPVITGRIIG